MIVIASTPAENQYGSPKNMGTSFVVCSWTTSFFEADTIVRFPGWFSQHALGPGPHGLLSPAWRREWGLKGRGITKMGRTAPVEETSRISGFGTFGASTTGKVLRFVEFVGFDRRMPN